MAATLITSDAVVLASISAKLRHQRRASFAFEKFTDSSRTRTMDQATQQMWPRNVGSPINMITDPWTENQRGNQKGGGYRYQIAATIPYTGQGKSGDAQLHGSELSDDFLYMEGYMNRKRQGGLEKVGDFNDALLGQWAKQTANEVGARLFEWLYYWKAWYGIPYALLWGHSRHIIGTDAQELAVTRRLNPNFYVCGLNAGTGSGNTYATWSATHATFMQNLARNIIQSVDAPQCYMTAENLDILYSEAIRLRLKPLNGDPANPMFACLIHIDQYNQLKQDDRFLASLQEFEGNAEAAKVWTSMGAIRYSNLIVFPGINGPCEVFPHLTTDTLTTYAAVSGDATDLEFGPVQDAAGLPERDILTPTNIDSATASAATIAAGHMSRRVGFVLGGDAIYGVQTKAERLVRDEWDYENKKGIAIDWMGGYSRCDWYNNPAPASATTVEHTGSIPFVTFSPRRSSVI